MAGTNQLARQQHARGIRESFGIVMNYLYDRDTIEGNYLAL
jgi:hypothetical protein